MLRRLHRATDRLLFDPGASMQLVLRCSRRLRAWHAWRRGALSECATLLRQLRWLSVPERRMLRNCEEMSASPCDPDTQGIAPVRHQHHDRPPTVHLALHSCQPLHPSGYGRRSESLIGALRRLGATTTVSTRPGYPDDIGMSDDVARKRLLADRVGYKLLPGPGLDRCSESEYVAGYASALRKVCADNRALVIHAASNYLNGLAATSAGASLGLPVVYEVRGLWHVTRATRESGYFDSEHYAYCDRQEVRACKGADRVVVLSDAVAEYLVARGVARERIALVPNAADIGSTARIDASHARERLGLSQHGKLFGYAGALVNYEGLPLLIELLDDTRLGDWTLVLAGHGGGEVALRALARARGVADRVRFTGYLDGAGVASLHAALDVCVIPRLDMLLTRLVPSQKPYEALAFGCPVVTSVAAALAVEPSLRAQVIAVDGREPEVWIDALLRAAAAPRPSASIPTWDDRAAALLSTYRTL